MLVESVKIKELVSQLSTLVDNIPKQIKRLGKEIDICDRETSDLLHLIELSNFHASEGYGLSRDLQITRKKRREFKDELELLSKINQGLKVHRPLEHHPQAIVKIVEQQNEALRKRTYSPRVRKDLTDKFKSIKQKELLS